jgi:protoporphyrinogen oxidase
MNQPELDLAIVGASLRGLQRARLAARDGQRVALFEQRAEPGGSARTLRSEGFAMELGPFALAAAEWDGRCRGLDRPPPRAALRDEAQSGWRWDGSGLVATPVDGEPCSGRTGIEDLAVSYRRELGAALRLGRAVTRLRPGSADAFELELGGEVPATAAARAVGLAVPLDVAARLCGAFDPALAAVAMRLRREPRAFAFLGTWQDDAAAAALRGFGVLVEEPGALRELLFCSNAFANRAVAGKALVRVELGSDSLGPDATAASDDDVSALAERELRRLTGWSGTVLFRRVHRFAVLVRDGAFTECLVRVRHVVQRASGLEWIEA